MTAPFTLSDFDFALPPELIAQHPAAERSASRLLDGRADVGVDRIFRDLPGLLRAGDLLVVNDTRVIKARLLGVKASGGAVEALVERVLGADRQAGESTDAEREPDLERVPERVPERDRGSANEGVTGRHEVLAHLRASKAPKPGSTIRFGRPVGTCPAGTREAGADEAASHGPESHEPEPHEAGADAAAGFEVEVLGREGPGGSLFRLRFPDDPFALLERHGHVPLPPYIAHAAGDADERRYQTVFAERAGAVAAPTAALHFDAALLEALRQRGVGLARITLHVGAGTFQPVRTENLAEHTMHSEWYEVGADTVAAIARTQAGGGRIVALGTTSLRALESAALASAVGAPGRPVSASTAGPSGAVASASKPGLRPGRGETDIFITPGFAFQVVDLLITNFHLPKSTLMMLVSAFAGHAKAMALYRHAVDARYRFFSYGDAMLLER